MDEKKYMYKVYIGFDCKITKYEVVKETPKQIFYIAHDLENREWRDNKESRTHVWHYNFQDAHLCLLAIVTQKLAIAEKNYTKVMAMKEAE